MITARRAASRKRAIITTRARDRLRDGGFALLAVIWILAFLSIASALFARSLQSHLAVARASKFAAEARSLAEAGVNLAILDLLQPAASGALRTAFTCRVQGDGIVSVSISDEAGRVDINTANATLLAALLGGIGLAPEDAAAKAAAIEDYRDADSVRSPDGAEREEYKAAGRLGPKNAAFEHTGELEHVLGFDAALVQRLSPFITVHSSQDGIDAGAAPAGLAELLAKGAPREMYDRVAAGPRQINLPVTFLSVSIRQNFSIRSEAVTASGARFVREAIVTVAPFYQLSPPPLPLPSTDDSAVGPGPPSRSRTPQPQNADALDYRLLDWREGVATKNARESLAAATGSC